METQLKNNLSTRILDSVIRWSPITMQDLKKVIFEQRNKDSIVRLTNLLIKKGYLQSESSPLIKSKVLYPTKLLIDQTGSLNKEHKGQYLVHNTLLTSFCIDLLSFSNVDEIFLEKDLNGFERSSGDLSPDAEAIIYYDNEPFKIAIEFEFTQKSKNRVIAKIDKFFKGRKKKKIFFIFKNEREASVYVNYFVEYLASANFKVSKEDSESVIFAIKNNQVSAENLSDLFDIIHPQSITNINLFFGKGKIHPKINHQEVLNDQ